MNVSVANTDNVSAKAPLVLVVDDEKTIADTLVAILRVNGFEAEAFYSPLAALQRTQGCRPDVLLSDVVMPEMDGYSLASIIKRKYPDCRILLLSGNAAAARFRCFSGEAPSHMEDIEVLSKPIPPTALIGRLCSLLSTCSD